MERGNSEAPAAAALSTEAFLRPEDHIRRIASGDSEAVGALYDQTSSLVYGLALRILGDVADAEEITLDVFTQVWKSASKFDPGRGSALAWLVMLTRSRSIDRLRSRADRDVRELPIADSRQPRDISNLPDESSFIRQQRMMVETALRRIDSGAEGINRTGIFLRFDPFGTRLADGASTGDRQDQNPAWHNKA